MPPKTPSAWTEAWNGRNPRRIQQLDVQGSEFPPSVFDHRICKSILSLHSLICSLVDPSLLLIPTILSLCTIRLRWRLARTWGSFPVCCCCLWQFLHASVRFHPKISTERGGSESSSFKIPDKVRLSSYLMIDSLILNDVYNQYL
jgi:hypothetical protein